MGKIAEWWNSEQSTQLIEETGILYSMKHWKSLGLLISNTNAEHENKRCWKS